MKDVVANRDRVARCGLYCGACGAYRKGRCPGCRENAKAGWCKVRTCCGERGYATCADCTDFPDPRDCAKHNNLIAKVIGFVLNSDRRACVLEIRARGLDGFAAFMTEKRLQTLPRRPKRAP